MKEHVRRVLSNELHDHYLGKRIQNEIISIMGKKFQESIISSVKKAKYYSVLLDCTPDQSHQEQLSFTLRFVTMDTAVSVEERFVNYVAITASTGEALATTLTDYLCSIQDMRRWARIRQRCQYGWPTFWSTGTHTSYELQGIFCTMRSPQSQLSSGRYGKVL